LRWLSALGDRADAKGSESSVVIRELGRYAGERADAKALFARVQDRDREIRSEAVFAWVGSTHRPCLAHIDSVFDDADAMVHLTGIGFFRENWATLILVVGLNRTNALVRGSA
jgi:hypothetical protein